MLLFLGFCVTLALPLQPSMVGKVDGAASGRGKSSNAPPPPPPPPAADSFLREAAAPPLPPLRPLPPLFVTEAPPATFSFFFATATAAGPSSALAIESPLRLELPRPIDASFESRILASP
jgi:hypothetical protein